MEYALERLCTRAVHTEGPMDPKASAQGRVPRLEAAAQSPGVVLGRLLSQIFDSAAAFLLREASFLFPTRDAGGNPAGWPPVHGFQAPAEAGYRYRLVPELAPCLSGRNHDPRGEMNQSDTGFRPVLMLPSLSPCHEGLDPALGQEVVVGLRDGKGLGEIVFLLHR